MFAKSLLFQLYLFFCHYKTVINFLMHPNSGKQFAEGNFISLQTFNFPLQLSRRRLVSQLANDLLNDAHLVGNIRVDNLVSWCLVMSQCIVGFSHQSFGDIDQIAHFGGVMFGWVCKVVSQND